MAQGGELSKKTGVEETSALRINDKAPNAEMVVALTGPDGPLGHGVQPKIGGVNEAGEKALLDALNGDKVTKVKVKKEKGEKNKVQEVGPKTKAQEAIEKKEDVLKAAAEARKFSIALKQCNYSGELVSGMMNFSTKMEKIFEKITELSSQNVSDEERWNKILDSIDAQMAWYTPAQARLSVMASCFFDGIKCK